MNGITRMEGPPSGRLLVNAGVAPVFPAPEGASLEVALKGLTHLRSNSQVGEQERPKRGC
jgi:hypothetical protein